MIVQVKKGSGVLEPSTGCVQTLYVRCGQQDNWAFLSPIDRVHGRAWCGVVLLGVGGTGEPDWIRLSSLAIT